MNARPDPARLPPVVTVAALYGAGGRIVGPGVADRLGVRFLDRAIPTTVARRAGVSEAAVADVDDQPQSSWTGVFRSLGRASPPNAASPQVERLDLEVRHLRAEIEEFLADASRAGGVVLGRGGAIVLASVPGVLHVYLGGNRRGRIDRVMRLNDLDRATAARRVDANDRARRAYVKEAYGVNGDDPELYQLMIDAVTLGVDVCVDMIVAAAESRVQGSARGKGDTGARRASAP
jgi:cytidylate kinase